MGTEIRPAIEIDIAADRPRDLSGRSPADRSMGTEIKAAIEIDIAADRSRDLSDQSPADRGMGTEIHPTSCEAAHV